MPESVVTPVEERIDHAEAKKTAEAWIADCASDVGNEEAWEELVVVARAYRALLTEHSARVKLQERIERVYPLAAQIRREVLTTPESPPERVTHGRHCRCSACKAQDWSEPGLAPCGMHGPDCPPVYAPIPPVEAEEEG